MPFRKTIFAPRKIFEQILQYAVIPTFDLIISFENRGVILVRRKIAPYKHTWALPGLRMMKPEGIEDTLGRIARQEIGVTIHPEERQFVGQYVGRFKTEQGRQDLSTCYSLTCNEAQITVNPQHFSGYCFVSDINYVPVKTGAMYRYFLKNYFNRGDTGN